VRECLFGGLVSVFIAEDASVVRDSKKGDGNRNCRESSDEGKDTATRGCEEEGLKIVRKVLKQSEQIRMGS